MPRINQLAVFPPFCPPFAPLHAQYPFCMGMLPVARAFRLHWWGRAAMQGRELRHTNQQLMEELRKLRMQLQLMGGGVGMASPDLQCTRMAEGDCQYIPVMHGAGGGRSMHYAGTGRQVPPPRHGDNLTGPTEVGSWDGGGGSVCGPLPQDPRLMAPVGGGQGPPAHQDYNGGQQLGGFPPASAGGVRLERTYSADFMDSISGDDPFSDNKQVRVKMDESWKGGVGGELSG
mmetsp:Transcript_6314/g.21733  ORF Transcript_6314/g.21733 Transcript_6314/m.21733 type:complete len:231 (+) Transcript_6314:417-1109(+)